MSELVDARGFSCPQPVLMTMDVVKKTAADQVEVLVDTDTSKENVSRAAVSQGWRVKDVRPDGIGYKLTLVKD